MDALVEAHHLYKYFGYSHAVDGVSLTIYAGEIYGLIGPDGAGKTTTLRLLCGALTPTHPQGQPMPSIRIAGYDLIKQTEQGRAVLGYLPQRFSLYDELTVLENIRFFSEVRGLKASEWRPRCMDILDFVGLAEFIHRRAGQLSGGMRQKLGLAAALVHRPRLLLLDEPTTGVDPVTRQDFWQLIIRLVANQDGGSDTAVLICTPYMDEAARCTKVGFMDRGRLLVEDTPGNLCNSLSDRVLELLGQPLPLLRQLAGQDEDVENVKMFGDRLHLRVRSGQAQEVMVRLADALPNQGGHIECLRTIPAQLEDVFMSLLEEGS